MRASLILAIPLLCGCTITGGYQSREAVEAERERKAAIQAEEKKQAEKQAGEREAKMQFEAQVRKEEIGILRGKYSDSIAAWKKAYVAEVEKMAASSESPDDICDAAVARTGAEQAAVEKAFSSWAELLTDGRRGSSGDVKSNSRELERELRLVGKSKVIEIRMSAKTEK